MHQACIKCPGNILLGGHVAVAVEEVAAAAAAAAPGGSQSAETAHVPASPAGNTVTP